MDPACIHASSQILKNLSPKKVDPCENFDEFVCGGWAETHDLRPDQGDIFEGTMMAERSQQILRHVLEGSYEDLRFSGLSKAAIAALTTSEEDNVDRANFEKLQTAYKTCLDEKEIEARGIKPIVPVFAKLEESFKDNDRYITDAITTINDIGATALVGFSIGADDRNPDSIVMSISSPRKIGLPSKQYYKDEKIVPVYTETIEKMFKNLKDALTEDIDRNATKVVEFERKLSDATMNPEDQNDITVRIIMLFMRFMTDTSIENLQSFLAQGSLRDAPPV
jgi:endothelin-converting enzyme